MRYTQPEVTVLLHTASQINQELDAWAAYLSANPFLELGSDRALVEQLESDLEAITRRLRTLSPYFDLDRVPLLIANYYFEAARRLDEAVAFATDLRRRAFGSIQFTRRFLEQIQLCVQTIGKMAQIVLFDSPIPIH